MFVGEIKIVTVDTMFFNKILLLYVCACPFKYNLVQANCTEKNLSLQKNNRIASSVYFYNVTQFACIFYNSVFDRKMLVISKLMLRTCGL